MDKQDAISTLSEDLGLSNDPSGLYQQLVAYINQLVSGDFQKLVSILYRMDVSEQILRKALEENTDSDAGELIAELMINRQIQKIESRQKFNQRDDKIDENEKW